ncbi:MAG: GGDEF domain-containing protein [Spirochaetes bacterium]|nr:GGDEF domain-containing protein [Spirochaetota bacterium]
MKKIIINNNIFFINNNLEKYSDYLKSESQNINFYAFDFNKLSTVVKKNKNIRREQNLIIINKEFWNKEIKEEIKKIFLKKLNISNPHILFICLNKNINLKEQIFLLEEQNFLYKISNAEKNSDKLVLNNFLLELIFQRIKDISRLNDYIINSFQTIVDSKVINKQKSEIEKLCSELESLSKIDVLTNVLNRRAFFDAMEREKSRTLRDIWRLNGIRNYPIDFSKVHPAPKELKNIIDKEPKGTFLDHYGRFSCIMLDIDSFKEVNDTFGHLAGDAVLKELGELLNSNSIFRNNDIIGRYGGEEFIVILPETNSEYAKSPAERLRKELKEKKFYSNGEIFHVTISIGISEFKTSDKSCEDLIDRADKALYYAKSHGKNMTIIYEDIFKE